MSGMGQEGGEGEDHNNPAVPPRDLFNQQQVQAQGVMDAVGEDHHPLGLVGDEAVDMGNDNQVENNENEDEDSNDEEESEDEEPDEEDGNEAEEEEEDRSWLPAEYSHIELPARPHSLPRHVIEAINPIRENQCLLCPRRNRRTYANKNTAIRHAISNHGFPIRCPSCQAQFRRSDDFNRHARNCSG